MTLLSHCLLTPPNPGKAFALLNAGGDEESFREEGIRSAKEAMAIAEAAGEEQKVAFVKMLLERDGKLEDSQEGSGCCQDKSEANCNEHDEVARAVATSGDGWSKEEESLLVQLVARDGSGMWQDKAAELSSTHRVDGTSLSGEEVESRWDEIAPRVKERLLEIEQERECGHTCATCPTRHDCQLHEAVGIDIEDLVPRKVPQRG